MIFFFSETILLLFGFNLNGFLQRVRHLLHLFQEQVHVPIQQQQQQPIQIQLQAVPVQALPQQQQQLQQQPRRQQQQQQPRQQLRRSGRIRRIPNRLTL